MSEVPQMNNSDIVKLSSTPQYNEKKAVVELVDKFGNVIVELERNLIYSIMSELPKHESSQEIHDACNTLYKYNMMEAAGELRWKAVDYQLSSIKQEEDNDAYEKENSNEEVNPLEEEDHFDSEGNPNPPWRSY